MQMAKKRLAAREKKLIRELLEEEELLLDEFIPAKQKIEKKPVTKKEEAELLSQLLGEAEKEYTDDDRQFVSNLLTRMPERKIEPREQEPTRNLDEELLHLHSTDDSHTQALAKALSSYPRVHRYQLIKLTLLLLAIMIVLAYIVTSTDLFELQHATGVVVQNSTLYVDRTVPKELHIEDILGNPANYEADQITATGYIKHILIEDRGAYRHRYYLVDDFGEELALSSVSDRSRALFPENGVSAGLYNITGKLREAAGDVELRVSFITSTTRPESMVSQPASDLLVGKWTKS